MASTKWALDTTHSELGFKIRHLMISTVSGAFTNFDVKVETEGEDFASAQVEASIEVASISTNNAQRDEHLRNADFFGTNEHSHMQFVSTGVELVEDDAFNLSGRLTIKDITHPVTLRVEYNGLAMDPWGNVKAGFSIGGKINRKDFGISYNVALETGGVVLGEEVKIFGEVQMVKQTAVVEAEAQ